jgi:hypothetical protein
VHATSMPLDACESPARACSRSVECDELYRIDKASMVLIVAEPQVSVQGFYVPQRSGGLSLTDGGLVFRSSAPCKLRKSSGSQTNCNTLYVRDV